MIFPEAISVLLTSVAGVGLLTYHASIARELRHSRRETSRFPMFAVRDELVDLVVDGKMSENDPAWRNLYEGINRILGMHHQFHSVDCLRRYLKRSVEIERNPKLKARFVEMRELEDVAAAKEPLFGEARDRAVEAFANMVGRRTTMWHRTILLVLFAFAYLLLISLKVGIAIPIRIGRSLGHPGSDALKIWDGPESLA